MQAAYILCGTTQVGLSWARRPHEERATCGQNHLPYGFPQMWIKDYHIVIFVFSLPVILCMVQKYECDLCVLSVQYNYSTGTMCSQVQSLVRIVLNTVEAQYHQCKRIPPMIVMPHVRARGM